MLLRGALQGRLLLADLWTVTESLSETDLIRAHFYCLVLVCQKLSRPVKVRLQSFEYLTLPIIFDQRRLTSPTQLSPALLREAKRDHQLRVFGQLLDGDGISTWDRPDPIAHQMPSLSSARNYLGLRRYL